MRSYLLLVRKGDETIEDLMKPWGKEVPIEGHWGDPVTEEEKQDLIQDYIHDMHDVFDEVVENPSFEEAYEEHGETYNENGWRKDSEGVWRHWIEWQWNPDGIWDSFVIGGGFDGAKFHIGDDSFVERAYKGDVRNLEALDFGELLLDGEWIEVSGKVYDYIKSLPDNAELVCIYYHF